MHKLLRCRFPTQAYYSTNALRKDIKIIDFSKRFKKESPPEFDDVLHPSYKPKQQPKQQQVTRTKQPVEKIDVNQYNTTLLQADQKLESRDYSTATQLYTQCINSFPNYAILYAQRGKAYLFKGELDLALADFSTALSLNDHMPDVYYNRAVLLFNRNKTQESKHDYDKCISLLNNTTDELLVQALNNRGYIRLEYDHDYQHALDDFERAIQISSTYELRYNCVRAYMGLHRYTDAVQ
jgi:tetratricopeptide (TPR) repeat protein